MCSCRFGLNLVLREAVVGGWRSRFEDLAVFIFMSYNPVSFLLHLPVYSHLKSADKETVKNIWTKTRSGVSE